MRPPHRPAPARRGPHPTPARCLVDRATWKGLEGTGDVTAVSAAWAARLRPGATVGDARAPVDDLACRGGHVAELTWCAADRNAGAYEAEADAFVNGASESSLPFVVDRARAIQVAVGGEVWPVADLAALAGAVADRVLDLRDRQASGAGRLGRTMGRTWGRMQGWHPVLPPRCVTLVPRRPPSRVVGR